MKIFNNISLAFTILGGIISTQLGGVDPLIQMMMYSTGADWATGVMKAFIKKELSSKAMFFGICKTAVMYILIGYSYRLSILTGKDLRTMVIWLFLSNNGLSVLENSSYFLPVSDKLKEILIQVRG